MAERPTKERLADELKAAGLRQLAARARTGHYDDYESRLAFPKRALVVELSRAGRRGREFVHRVTAGEFDNSPAEAAAWEKTPEGREAMEALKASAGIA